MPSGSDLTFHQFRVFDTVVRSGSLTRAALSLDVPQPSVSRVVARLEREVGALLLNRFSTGVTLTAAGERFHENALLAMQYHDLAVEEARASKGLLKGEVRIAAPDSVGGILFAPLVQNIKGDHRELRPRTIVSQSREIPGMLASGSIDIGIVADTHEQPSGVRDRLFREELYLVGPDSSPLIKRKEIPLADAGGTPLVLNAMPGGFRTLIDEGFSSLGIDPRVEIEIDANNALMELLANGAGHSILPYSLVAALHGRTSLGAARLTQPSLIRTLSLITAPNRPISSVVREAIRRIRAVVKQESVRARWLPIE